MMQPLDLCNHTYISVGREVSGGNLVVEKQSRPVRHSDDRTFLCKYVPADLHGLTQRRQRQIVTRRAARSRYLLGVAHEGGDNRRRPGQRQDADSVQHTAWCYLFHSLNLVRFQIWMSLIYSKMNDRLFDRFLSCIPRRSLHGSPSISF